MNGVGNIFRRRPGHVPDFYRNIVRPFLREIKGVGDPYNQIHVSHRLPLCSRPKDYNALVTYEVTVKNYFLTSEVTAAYAGSRFKVCPEPVERVQCSRSPGAKTVIRTFERFQSFKRCALFKTSDLMGAVPNVPDVRLCRTNMQQLGSNCSKRSSRSIRPSRPVHVPQFQSFQPFQTFNFAPQYRHASYSQLRSSIAGRFLLNQKTDLLFLRLRRRHQLADSLE